MNKATFLCLLGIIMFNCDINPLFSQTCGSHQHLDEYINEQVKAGKLTPEEGRKRLEATTNQLHTRSSVVRVFVVFDYSTTTSALSLASAQAYLKSCASGTSACEITYQQVNARTNFAFTTSTDAPTMLDNLESAAIANGWYNQADVVVGITSLDIANYAGYARIGTCTPIPTGRATVIEATTTQALYAHELGHTIGLLHDDLDNSVADHNLSLMNPIVYNNANTMSTSNRACYKTAASCVLPIELLSFTGSFQQNKNYLSWTTASEKNNKGFQIERSYDAIHWLSIGYVKGVGNSATQNSYNYQDASPLGLSYYRLRQQDFDGTETFSNIVSIKSESKTKVILAPNPVQNDLVIAFESETYAEEVNVYDMLGRVIFQSKKPSNRLEVDMRNVQAGMYIVEINVDGKRVREKVLKVNE
jgi:Secretion system C-terminal sorting domain